MNDNDTNLLLSHCSANASSHTEKAWALIAMLASGQVGDVRLIVIVNPRSLTIFSFKDLWCSRWMKWMIDALKNIHCYLPGFELITSGTRSEVLTSGPPQQTAIFQRSGWATECYVASQPSVTEYIFIVVWHGGCHSNITTYYDALLEWQLPASATLILAFLGSSE